MGKKVDLRNWDTIFYIIRRLAHLYLDARFFVMGEPILAGPVF